MAEIEREILGVGEAPRGTDVLLDLTVVPCDKGTLVSLRSDVLETFVTTSISAVEGEVELGREFSPDGMSHPLIHWSRRLSDEGKPEEWPAYIAHAQCEQLYTEVGNGQYNPLPFLLKGLKDGVSLVMGPTSRAMREGYVAALLNFAEELFRTYGDKRGVKGTLRVVKDV